MGSEVKFILISNRFAEKSQEMRGWGWYTIRVAG